MEGKSECSGITCSTNSFSAPRKRSIIDSYMKPIFTRWRLIILLAGSILASAQDVAAGSRENQMESLRGLSPIAFTIAPLPEWIEKVGTSREELDAIAKRKFNNAGVPMVIENKPPAGSLIASVSGNVYRSSRGRPVAYMFTLDLSLYQPVLLATKRAQSGITWRAEVAGLYQFDTDVASGVKVAFEKMLDEFIRDYIVVNPRAGSK